MKLLHLLILPFLLTACQKTPSPSPALATTPVEGHVFAQASCGECHAVGRVGASPRSNAPPFPVIVNQEGVNAETLSVWLRGAHNYPKEMDFYLGQHDVNSLVAYMLTLKDPNYTPTPN